MFDKVTNRSNDFVLGLIAGSCIIGMTLSIIFTLAGEASRPAAHPAPYAVTHSPYLKTKTDQGRATSVSLSGLAPDHSLEEVVQ